MVKDIEDATDDEEEVILIEHLENKTKTVDAEEFELEKKINKYTKLLLENQNDVKFRIAYSLLLEHYTNKLEYKKTKDETRNKQR